MNSSNLPENDLDANATTNPSKTQQVSSEVSEVPESPEMLGEIEKTGVIRWFLLALLIVPLVIIYIVTQYFPIQQSQWCDNAQEYIDFAAPFLVTIAFVIYIIRAGVSRNPLVMLMAGLSAAFLCREFHWGWTDKGVYIMVAILGILAGVFYKKLRLPLQDRRYTFWLIAVASAYIIATLLDRRILKRPPIESLQTWEKIYHSLLEEVAETLAHLTLIISAIAGSWKKQPKLKPKPETTIKKNLEALDDGE